MFNVALWHFNHNQLDRLLWDVHGNCRLSCFFRIYMFRQLIYRLTFGIYPIHTTKASFKDHKMKLNTQCIHFITLSVLAFEKRQHCSYNNKEVKRFPCRFCGYFWILLIKSDDDTGCFIVHNYFLAFVAFPHHKRYTTGTNSMLISHDLFLANKIFILLFSLLSLSS